MLQALIPVGQIAAAVSGHKNFLSHLLIFLQKRHFPAAFCRGDSRHHSGGPASHDQNPFHACLSL